MTTRTMTEAAIIASSTSWAQELGAKLAARRAEREGEREAEAAAEKDRRRLPIELLRRRFAATVNIIIPSIDAFAAAAEMMIEAAPPAATLVELRAHGGEELLRLALDDDTLVVTLRGRSRSEERHLDLGAEAFSPDDTARTVAGEWIQRLAAAEEGPTHGPR